MRVRRGFLFANRRTVAVVTALLVATAATLALVLLSPFVLIWIGAIREEDWTRLSNIGQTYGAASAVLSAMALGGIAVSLIIQSRDGRAAQAASVREFHRELLETTALEPQRLLPSWGWTLGDDVSDQFAQQIMFAHLICRYATLGYEFGVIDEAQLRQLTLKHFFSGEVGRQYWGRMGREASNNRSGKMIRRFTAIAEDEYAKAVAAGPPAILRGTDGTSPTTPRPQSANRIPGTLATAAAASALIIAAATIAHRRRI